MYCNQCEQTAGGFGCTVQGVCGKTPSVAALQDMLVYALRGLALVALAARKKGVEEPETDHFAARALFATLTNVNFDEARLLDLLQESVRRRKELASHIDTLPLGGPASLEPEQLPRMTGPGPQAGQTGQAERHVEGLQAAEGIEPLHFSGDVNIRSVMQLLLYGLKGMAAYADHAALLGQGDPAVFSFLYEGLAAGYDDRQRSFADWLELIRRCGMMNLRAMELLDTANTQRYGDPVPTPVTLGHRPGKCLVVSGHDLRDLHDVLMQTEGKGIDVYTHGEMLPCHAYPKLKKFSHFYGHYGTAWQNQHKELADFPGAVLFTTNCIQNPQGYADKVFTSGVTGWPGLVHCENRDFSPLIEKALAMPGFTDDVPGKSVLVGFGRKAALYAVPAVLDAVAQGKIRHIFLVGGCDGARPGRNYYTEFVEKAPTDSLILTLACGKFRFFDKSLGSIGELPRLMDMGQCNDAYSAIRLATVLAEKAQCSINELPLSIVLSWYEQKAAAVLLTLLALGVKRIVLGPSLPAFVSEDIFNILVREYGIAPVTTPDKDLERLLAAKES